VIVVRDAATLHLSLTSASSFSGGFIIRSAGPYGGGTLDLTSAGAALGLPIDFADAGTTLRIDDTTMPGDVVSGFLPGARFIFLAETPYASSGSATVLAGNVLQVKEGAVTDDLQLDPSVNYSALFAAGNSLVLLPHSGGDTLVTIGQVVTVSSGTGITGSTISSGIIEEIFGSAVSTTVVSGGTQVVFAGGTASATVLSGADEFVYGTDTSTTLVSGATLWVETGATASGDTVGNGGSEQVYSGAVVSSATVNEGGLLNLLGGTAYNTLVSGITVNSGGVLNVSSGGEASGTKIVEFGNAYVSSGGTVVSTTLIGNGNFDPDGGFLAIRGGIASGTVVSSGGVERVGPRGFTGSEDVSGTILAGGQMTVFSGSMAISATVIGNGNFDPNGGRINLMGTASAHHRQRRPYACLFRRRRKQHDGLQRRHAGRSLWRPCRSDHDRRRRPGDGERRWYRQWRDTRRRRAGRVRRSERHNGQERRQADRRKRRDCERHDHQQRRHAGAFGRRHGKRDDDLVRRHAGNRRGI
jgi:autotransporter passenger strand-loop-strand repeat protein